MYEWGTDISGAQISEWIKNLDRAMSLLKWNRDARKLISDTREELQAIYREGAMVEDMIATITRNGSL